MDEGGTLTEKAAFGEYARVYDYTGSGNALADTMNESMELGVGTFALTDTRDSKDYLVRRLADGNCWMVQNLDLDLNEFVSTAEKRLTPENTDVAETWIPDASTNTKITSTYASQLADAGLTSDFAGLMTWMNNITVQTQQFQNSTLSGTNQVWGVKRVDDTTPYTDLVDGAKNNSYAEIPRSYDNTVYGTDDVRYIAMDISTGKAYRTANVSSTTSGWTEGGTPNNNPVATTTTGLISTSKLTTPGADAESTSDDVWNFYGSMYIGKYYNWYAATAETGTYSMGTGGSSMASNQAASSVCPSGWELPYDYSYTAGNNKAWYNLLINIYNIEVANTDGEEDTANAMQTRLAPLSITFAGYYSWKNGALGGRGDDAGFWSRSASSNNAARDLATNSVGRVTPQYIVDKLYGVPIRCVAHGTEIQSQESQDAVATTCSAKNICYDANGGTGTMNNQSANANASVVLTAPTFTRLGYSFAGWSTQDNGFGTVYGPNETITTPSTLATTGLRLYAKWLPSTGTMQDFTTAQCNALGTHQSVALTDNRDGNTYTVTKLKDGNCWMTTNLALNLADFAGDNPTKGYLTTANTDIGNDKDGSGNPTRTDLIDISSNNGGNSGVLRWDPEKSTRTKWETTYASALQSRGLTQDFTGLSELLLGQAQPKQFQSYDDEQPTGWWWGSAVKDDGSFEPLVDPTNTDRNNTNAQMPRSYNVDDSTGHGNLYNWFSANAESGDYSTSQSTDSICAKGWKIPEYYNPTSSAYYPTTSYNNLINAYGLLGESLESSQLMRGLPLSYQLDGYISLSGGGHNVLGSTAYWWSSTTSGSTGKQVRSIQIRPQDLVLNASAFKAHGYSVRCVLK